MIRIVLVEDEPIAARKLQRQLEKSSHSTEVIALIESVAEGLAQIPKLDYDLLLLDIHLSDGSSFQLFDHLTISTPIIFTTAFDEYAIKAFKYHSIDYLMKPISQVELDNALDHFAAHYGNKNAAVTLSKDVIAALLNKETNYRKRFLVKNHHDLIAVETKEIHRFFIENRSSYLQRSDGSIYSIDFNLTQLEKDLNPENFFRINRTSIIGRDAIDKMKTVSNGRIKLSLNKLSDTELYVSADRASGFKKWLGS